MERSISAMIQSLFIRLQNTGKSKQWDIGVTAAQIKVLIFIGQRRENGLPTYQKDIEREFGVKGSSVTSLLNNLEKNKWIKRESVEHDARLKSIVFAERSLLAMKQFFRVTAQLDACLRESITDAEFIVFCQCMDKMQLSIEKHRDELSHSLDELVDMVKNEGAGN